MYLATFHGPRPEGDFWGNRYASFSRLGREEVKKVFSLSSVHTLAIARLVPAGKILDAGCGVGVLTILNPHAGAQVVGIDSSAKVLEEARRLSPEAEFHQGSVTALPFPEGSFDQAVAVSSLELVPEGLGPVLVELHRVLKGGGRVLVASPRLPAGYWLRRAPIIAATPGIFRLRGVPGPVFPFPPDAYGYYYSRRELVNALRQTGFTDIRPSRSDLLGGISYAWLLGQYLQAPLGRWIARIGERILKGEENSRDRFWADLILRESGSQAAPFRPILSALRFFTSFWNIVEALRP